MGSAVSYLSLAQRIPLNGSFRDGHDLWASAVLPRSSPMLVKCGRGGSGGRAYRRDD